MNNQELKDYIETQEKQHYESLRNLFKWIIGALTILFTAGASIIGANLYQINNKVDLELTEAKEKIAELKSEGKQYLIDAERRANLQIELIEKEAKIAALEAVKIKVERELQTPQVQQFIYSELRSNINDNLDLIVDESFNKASKSFDKLTRETSELNTAFHFAYWNDISQVKFLDSVAYNSNDRRLRETATFLFRKVQSSYKHFYGLNDNKRYSRQIQEKYTQTKDFNDIDLAKFLIDKILVEKESDELTPQFQALIELTGFNIEILEFQKLKKTITEPPYNIR